MIDFLDALRPEPGTRRAHSDIVEDADPGDEHREPPTRTDPTPRCRLDELLEEWGDEALVVDEHVWEMMSYHEYMRDCCRGCALEVCGEDGS